MTPFDELARLIEAAEADLARIPVAPHNAVKIADRRESLERLKRTQATLARRN